MAPSMDDVMASMRQELVDEAEDSLNKMEILLEGIRNNSEDAEEALIRIKRPAHSLKGAAYLADFPVVGMVMHKLEDYISPIKKIETGHIDDIQYFIDTARKYSDLSVDQNAISEPELMRELPGRRASKAIEEGETPQEKSDTHQFHVLMVIRERTPALLFERELAQYGLDVTLCENPAEAIDIAVRCQPDMVMTSGILGAMNGVDIACGISAMPKTKDIPVAILTSFDRDHNELQGLPAHVSIIRKNQLKEDLKQVLEPLGVSV